MRYLRLLNLKNVIMGEINTDGMYFPDLSKLKLSEDGKT